MSCFGTGITRHFERENMGRCSSVIGPENNMQSFFLKTVLSCEEYEKATKNSIQAENSQ